MNVNTKSLVSITEANQNFSKVARLVDENGSAVILKIIFLVTLLLNSVRQKTNRLLLMKMLWIFQKG